LVKTKHVVGKLKAAFAQLQ